MDRTIRVLCKKKGIPSKQYKLGFVDYLGTATAADRRTYWKEFHKDNFFVKVYGLAARLANKLKRALS